MTNGGYKFICALAYYNANGLSKAIANSATSTNAWLKDIFTPLAPFANEMTDTNVWVSLIANRDKGRSVEMSVFGVGGNIKGGDATDSAIRAWIKSTGQAILASLDNDPSKIEAFPAVPIN